MGNDQDKASPVEVPLDALKPETVLELIESFVLREGTDYGANEVLLETKVKQVHKQVQNGDVKIVFDPDTESVTLMTKRDWSKLLAQQEK